MDEKTLRGIQADAQRAINNARPHIIRAQEEASRITKEMQPHLDEAMRYISRMQPYILKSMEVYYIDWKTIDAKEAHQAEKPDLPKNIRLGMGLFVVAENSFKYKSKNLRAITMNSKAGKLLTLFLEQPDYFLSDELAFRKLGVSDSRDLQFILRDLRRAFKKNGLVILIEDRKKPDGYLLIDIKKQI